MKRKYSSSSSGSFNMRKLAKYATSTASSAAGSYFGPVGAYVGGAVGDAFGDYAFTEEMDKDFEAYKRSGLTQKNSTMGFYKGAFKKASKFNLKTFEGYYTSKGYVQRRETNGVITDDHACYVGHSTFDPVMIQGTVAGCLLRKLMKIGGVAINDRSMVLPMNTLTSAVGYRVEFSTITENGVIALYDNFNFLAATNFSGILGGMGTFQNFIGECLIGEMVEIAVKPYMLTLYQQDIVQISPSEVSTYRLVAKMDLSEEIIDLQIHSELTVQNRTNAAQAAAGSFYNLDRTDNQPLKGRIYEFRNGDPRLRISNAAQTLIDQVPIDGAILVRAAELGTDWQNVPPPNQFANISKSGLVKMDPGHMKKGYINYSFHGTFINMLVKLRAATFTAVGGITYAARMLGHCQLIGFEEEMRTPSTNPVAIAYERQLTVGATCKTKPAAPLKAGLEISVRNNPL